MDSSVKLSAEMRIHESDFRDNMSLQGIMLRFQEALEDYTESINCSCAYMTEKYGISWMLATMHLEMLEYPHTGDMVETKLFPVERFGALMPWYYVLSDGKGKVYGYGSQGWLIADIRKRKILRPSELPGTITPDTENERPCMLPKKSLVLPEGLEKTGTHTVLYSDTDMNGHMNNTRYVSMFMDAFPKEKHEKHIIREFDCFFKKETSIGHELEIFSSDMEKEEVYMKCTENGKDVFLARILWR